MVAFAKFLLETFLWIFYIFVNTKKRDSFVNFFFLLSVTESLGDGRMFCCFCIVKTKNKHAVFEICFDVIVEFVLGAQIMGSD